MKFKNILLEKIKKIGRWLLEEFQSLEISIVTRPKFVLFRLEIFRWSPFLSKHVFKILLTLVVFLSFFASFYLFSWRSPRPFPDHALVTINKGDTLSLITKTFEEKNIVRSGIWLRFFVTLLSTENKVIAGDYYFPEPKNIFSIARMLHDGNFGLIPIRVTVPEGLSSHEMADIFAQNLPAFNKEDFLTEVVNGGFEGYLFPDTYFFMPNTKHTDVMSVMRENFARQISVYEEDIIKSENTLSDIITMASIIEDESSHSLEAKRIVSGILWKRLRIDMPLQVDAPFIYHNGLNSYTLTSEDLKEDHPYNTYVNKGLPPTAITNPGIDSIRAAIAPTNTEYLYFMSDRQGNLYYAKDFEGHQANRERYLR